MFGIGLPELILILIVALLVVGPKKLPDLARSLGRALHDVKSMTEDVKQSFVGDLDLEANPDKDGQKTVRGPGEEPEFQKKDDAATDPGTGHQPPGKEHSDPYGGDLRG
jgi:Tat protein translocase TatB subunit